MAEQIQLTKGDRLKVAWRSTFLQGSWNYERMQNGGWAFAMMPALRKLYQTQEGLTAAVKRHLEFFNTHPYLASPILGVTLALEEERANGAAVDDAAIEGVKVGMMGPLAGVGDPVFWFTARPMLGALGASLALSGNIAGPILFFVLWNIIRWAFMWYSQELGYKQGSRITEDLSGGLLQDVTKGASILGMFVLAGLIQRWVNIDFKIAIEETSLQENLDSLIPGLVPLLLTFLCMWLLRKKVSPIIIILGLFAVGIGGHLIGWL
jgi:PTS system mannose-specific IID component